MNRMEQRSVKALNFPNFENIGKERPTTIGKLNVSEDASQDYDKTSVKNAQKLSRLIQKFADACQKDSAEIFEKNFLVGNDREKTLVELADYLIDPIVEQIDKVGKLEELIISDLNKIYADKGGAGDEDKAAAKRMAENIVKSMSQHKVKIVSFDKMSKAFSDFTATLEAYSETESPIEYDVNPMSERINRLKEGRGVSTPCSRPTFHAWLVAAGTKFNKSLGMNPYELFSKNKEEAALANVTLRQVFVEKGTMGLMLGEQMASAFEIYDLSGEWVDDIPYFKGSLLDVYMKSHKLSYKQLLKDRRGELKRACGNPPNTVCSDCGRHLDACESVMASRRTFAGLEGAESYYCDECAEKTMTDFLDLSKEGKMEIIADGDMLRERNHTEER